MINKTIKKIKEYADAIASITRDFATAIASVFAALTAGITGYREVKKLLKRPEMHHHAKTGANIYSSPTPGPVSATAIVTTNETAADESQLYSADYNTLFFGLSSAMLIGVFIFSKFIKKKTK